MTSPVGSAEAGYTLLELLAVLVILALVAGIAAPRLADMARPAVTGDAAALAASLRFARQQAVFAGRESVLMLDIEAGTWSIDGAPAGRLNRSVHASITTDADEAGRAHAAVRFYPDGRSSGARIALAAGDVARRIEIDWLTGHVTLAVR